MVIIEGDEMNTQAVLPIFQLILTAMNICILGFAFFKFLGKPHTSLEQRVNEHDVKIREIETSLLQGNDRFREQESTNEVIQQCMLALIDFELAYCIHTNYGDTEDLMKAKEVLRKHLSRK